MSDATHRSTLKRLVAGMVAIATPAALSAYGAQTPVSQTRTTAANSSATASVGTPDADVDAESAPGFAPFVSLLEPFSTSVGTTAFAFGQGVARQNTDLSGNLIKGTGRAASTLTLVPLGVTGASASASADANSLFDLTFLIGQLSNFTLSGMVDLSTTVTGGAPVPTLDNDVRLIDVDNGNTILFSTASDDESFLVNGALPPGTYRLIAEAESAASASLAGVAARTVNGTSTYEFQLSLEPVPVPEASTVIAGVGIAGLCAATWVRRRRPAPVAA